ncbi:MAG: aromatic-ring-hydroxylating dioxygenase subunit beta [Pseudomonadota bacterium]
MSDSLAEQVNALFSDYGWLLDTAHYDAWLELFVEDAFYQIMPRENLEAGLAASLIYCRGKDMLRDRVTSLVEVNKYNIHGTRHILGRSRLGMPAAELIPVATPFAVYQTDQEGVSQLFAVGAYDSQLIRQAGALRLASQIVQLDTFSVPTLLSDPL